MTDILASILVLLILFILVSVTWDYWFYEDRQKKWERDHPGDTYLPGYCKYEKKSAKARKLGGEL